METDATTTDETTDAAAIAFNEAKAELLSSVDQMKAWAEEPLDPELEPFVEDGGPFGRVLKHPWVIEVPLTLPGRSNQVYRHKRDAVNKAIQEKNWHSFVWLHERPWRIHAMMTMRDRDDGPDDAAWWDLFSEVWIDSENLWQYDEELTALFGETGPDQWNMMMDDDERARLNQLPETVTVYRGVNDRGRVEGWSWTLDKSRAAWFAQRLGSGPGRLVVGRVDRAKIIALQEDRGEDEVIVWPEDVEVVRVGVAPHATGDPDQP